MFTLSANVLTHDKDNTVEQSHQQKSSFDWPPLSKASTVVPFSQLNQEHLILVHVLELVLEVSLHRELEESRPDNLDKKPHDD